MGLGFRGSGFRGLGLRVRGLGVRDQGSGVCGSGFRGLVFRVGVGDLEFTATGVQGFSRQFQRRASQISRLPDSELSSSTLSPGAQRIS